MAELTGAELRNANAMAVGAGVLDAYASGQLAKTSAIYQGAAMVLQARDSLAIAEVRAEYSEQYATIQAGRVLKRAEIEATNHKMVGNQLLRNLRSVNASARARAAANGVQLGSGSIEGIQRENTAATLRDVDMADFNALAAQVFGFEDASAMIESTKIQNILDLYAANANVRMAEAGSAQGIKQAGLLQNAKMSEAFVNTTTNLAIKGKK